MTLRVVVADDEPIAAGVLARELERLGCVVVAICDNGSAAVAACAGHVPDACFTDIVMPARDGFEVARELGRAAPGVCVVFVSAYANFAADAFGVDVVDYLVKPVRRARLEAAVERVRRARAERRANGGVPDERIVVTEHGNVYVLGARELEWVQADGYSVWLHTAQRSWLLRDRMHRLESRLEPHGFFRVHRSALVRRASVEALLSSADEEPYLVLRSGARVRVARDRLALVREWLG